MRKHIKIKQAGLIFILLNAFLLTSLAGCAKTSSFENSKEQDELLTKEEIKVIETSVLRVVDGDTLEVSMNGSKEKVRMIGVNTPETHHPTKPVELFGPEAEEFTRSQLNGKTIYLEIDIQERDNYGRILGYVWLAKPHSDEEDEVRNKMFNAKLLTEGYAQVMTIPPNVKYAELFVTLQAEANKLDKGIWGISEVNTSEAKTPEVNTSAKKEISKKGPNGETIKGNINAKGEKIYHLPGGQFYQQTIPEQWFFSEEEAQKAGFRASQR